MSRTGCHDAGLVVVSARARSMCGELVLCWVLTKIDVFDKCSHNENTFHVYRLISRCYSGY